MKPLKFVVIGIGALLALVVIAIAIIAATFDPNKYKPDAVKFVKDKYGRTLDIDGRIGLTFFPSIGASVDKVRLSEPGSARTFAKIDEAKVSVKLLPLFSKQVIVDEVTLNGLAVDLVKHKGGRTNFDDLVGRSERKAAKPDPGQEPDAPPGGMPVVDIGGVTLKNAEIGWQDEGDGTQVRVSGLNLKTGRIASGVPGKLDLSAKLAGAKPKVDLKLDLATRYRVDFESRAAQFSGLDLRASGDAPGANGLDATLKGDIDFDPAATRVNLSGVELNARSKEGLDAKLSIPKLALAPDKAESKSIDGTVKLVKPGEVIDAKIALSSLTMRGRQIEFAQLGVDLDVKQGELAVKGRIATPVALDLDQGTVKLAKLSGDLDVTGPALPPKGLKLALAGSGDANWSEQTAAAAILARIEDSNVNAKISVSDFSPLAVSFDVVADKLNVDRYLPPRPQAGLAAGGVAPRAGAAAAPAGAPTLEKAIDLSGLKNLNAQGNVRIGALTVSHVSVANLNVGVKAGSGRLDLNPISAGLYGGNLAGAASVNANGNTFAVRNQLTGVNVGPLVRALADKDLIEGRGNIALDVTTAGTTVTALKKGLNGTASVALRDGAFKGINLAETFRQVKAALGSKGAIEQQGKGGDQTDFSEMTASFVIRNGVAHNDDLSAKSPFVRLAGAGDINIGAGAMDYLAKASVVSTSAGQGGKDSGELKGVTVPVRVVGPFEALSYKVDVAAFATDAARQEITRRLEERVLGKPGEGGSGKPADLLRGLFGGKR